MNATRPSKRTTRAAIIATSALAIGLVGVAGAQAVIQTKTTTKAAAQVAEGSTSGPDIHFWTSGKVAPGAEIDVYADCGENKNGKAVTQATVGGVATTVLTPLADAPYLGGTVLLPHDFVSPSSLSLTCDNMATATTILVTGQTESTADGLIPSLESGEYEHEQMADDNEDSSTEAPSDFWDGDGYLVPDDCEGGHCTGAPVTAG